MVLMEMLSPDFTSEHFCSLCISRMWLWVREPAASSITAPLPSTEALG